MTEPKYDDADLAAAEAEEAAEDSTDPAPETPDTEADEKIDGDDGDVTISPATTEDEAAQTTITPPIEEVPDSTPGQG